LRPFPCTPRPSTTLPPPIPRCAASPRACTATGTLPWFSPAIRERPQSVARIDDTHGGIVVNGIHLALACDGDVWTVTRR
jgi:hypothetical protein